MVKGANDHLAAAKDFFTVALARNAEDHRRVDFLRTEISGSLQDPNVFLDFIQHSVDFENVTNEELMQIAVSFRLSRFYTKDEIEDGAIANDAGTSELTSEQKETLAMIRDTAKAEAADDESGSEVNSPLIHKRSIPHAKRSLPKRSAHKSAEFVPNSDSDSDDGAADEPAEQGFSHGEQQERRSLAAPSSRAGSHFSQGSRASRADS